MTATPREEKGLAKHAWIILVVVGFVGLVTSLAVLIIGTPIDAPGVKNLTGMSWDQLVASSPGAAKLVVYFVRQFAVAALSLAIVLIAVAAVPYRKGERWAWYVSAATLIALVGYIALNLDAGGSLWPTFTGLLIVSILGLVLPIRKFFPKAQVAPK